jgi:sulfopyruvate decarboxylase alpha subunit
MNMPASAPADTWPDEVFDVLKRADVRMMGYVPDAGHTQLINRCRADSEIEDVVLTTEEEGIGLIAGAWLGGKRGVLLMQSSGVGNCVNTMSLQMIARFPLPIIVTMRGEYAEFNPWQIPMGAITEASLKLCNFQVYRANAPEEVAELVEAALDMAFNSDIGTAVLLSQSLIGRKKWVKG